MPNPIVDFPWSFREVHGDLLVKTGAGVLHTIVINGITTIGTCSVYDGIDNGGTLIGTLSLTSAVQVSCQPITLIYDCKVATGIYFDVTTFVGSLTCTFK